MSQQTSKIVTAGILQDAQGRVLLCRRALGQSHAGDWEFPGGKLEPGETLPECLTRELREELGIFAQVGLEIIDSEYQYSKGTIRLVALAVLAWQGELTVHVHDALAWVEITHLLDYALSPADIPIARHLASC